MLFCASACGVHVSSQADCVERLGTPYEVPAEHDGLCYSACTETFRFYSVPRDTI